MWTQFLIIVFPLHLYVKTHKNAPNYFYFYCIHIHKEGNRIVFACTHRASKISVNLHASINSLCNTHFCLTVYFRFLFFLYSAFIFVCYFFVEIFIYITFKHTMTFFSTLYKLVSISSYSIN